MSAISNSVNLSMNEQTRRWVGFMVSSMRFMSSRQKRVRHVSTVYNR